MTRSGSRRAPRGSRGRQPRAKQQRGASHAGERFEATVGPIAHGGHHVVRHDDRVIFVRHGLEGERVLVEVTEGTDGDRFWRGDAVEVLEASPDRVAAPCRFAGPGGCGGCDFQHVDLAAQRAMKARVVTEQLRRLGGVDASSPLLTGLVVEQVPGDVEGLGWRTRQRYVDLGEGRRGMRKHRSHEVVEIDECLIEAPEGLSGRYRVRGRDFAVAPGGFWQVHPGAPATLVDAVVGVLRPRSGETAVDLYAGVGLFSVFLAEAVGEQGQVLAIEGDARAAGLITTNAPGVAAYAGDVAEHLDVVVAERPELRADLVVLDPPRAGAKRAVVERVAALAPRAIAYVACDPAALARDVAIFAERGYRLESLRAFDLFPMTHHVECVALLTKTGSDLR